MFSFQIIVTNSKCTLNMYVNIWSANHFHSRKINFLIWNKQINMPYISFLFCLFVDNLIDMWLCWIVQYYVGSFISVNIVIDRPKFVSTHCIGISVYFDVDWIWTEIYYIAIKIFEQKNIVREEQTQNEWMQTTTKKPPFICFKLFFISSNISVFMHNCEKYHITPQWKKYIRQAMDE